MYLIKIQTLQLKEFIGEQVPPYAILSHRWGTGELNFKDVLKNRADKSSRGYRKMLGACQAAKSYEVEYVWIDTCCIDKKSSAELSEAINSMFSWYWNAEVCLTYLEDVNSLGQDLEQSFKNSKWFTRAWTLQELLAPRALDFYDCQWIRIGSRQGQAELIQNVTRIPPSALNLRSPHRPFQTWSIAERMSWAGEREATRTEDIAYSLMGLFDVNMPLLYGEGSKAFIRLQEEIIRNSTTDPSILSWGFFVRGKYQLLACRPAEFRDSPDTTYVSGRYLDTPLHLTSIGLSINSTICRWQLNKYVLVTGEYLSMGVRLKRCLLLQLCPDWNRVYAIGVLEEKEAVLHDGYFSTKTLTIQRHLPVSGLRMAQTASPRNGFVIVAAGTQLSITVDPEAANPWREIRANVHWESLNYEATSHTMMFCTFDTAMSPGSARFHVDCAGSTIWVDAYFDFDSRPCVCIGLEPIVISSLLDLPNHDANLVPVVMNDGPGQEPLRKLQDGFCRGQFFFSASLDFAYRKRIPTIPPVIVSLVPPNGDFNATQYWLLEFYSSRYS